MTLFYDVVGPTALGAAATARVAIDAAYRVPAKARELVGVRPWIMHEAPAADEALIAVWDILGNDYRYQPCEGLCPVGSGKIGTISCNKATPMETWKIHAPLNGNETLDLGIELLSALAGNGEGGFTMIFSTVRTGKPTIYGKASREVAGPTTAATITACTNLRVDNGVTMKEIWGVAVSGTATPTADEEFAGYFTVRCSGWDPIQETRFFHSPLHAPDGATSTAGAMSIMRLPFDPSFKSKQATIRTTHYNYDAYNAAGVLAHGVRWLGT